MNDEYEIPGVMITPNLLKFLKENPMYDVSIMYDENKNSYKIGIHDYKTNFNASKYVDVSNIPVAAGISVEETVEFTIRFYTDKLKRDFSGSV